MTEKKEIAIIYKPAGTDRDGVAKTIPLSVHAAELTHFGIDQIHSSCTTTSPHGLLSTGQPMRLNVFIVPVEVWDHLQRRIGGTFGFRHWQGSPFPDLELEDNMVVRQLDRTDIADTPVLIRDLIGRRYRAYKTNDGIDRNRNPDRVNIESDADGIILGIWIG